MQRIFDTLVTGAATAAAVVMTLVGYASTVGLPWPLELSPIF